VAPFGEENSKAMMSVEVSPLDNSDRLHSAIRTDREKDFQKLVGLLRLNGTFSTIRLMMILVTK